MGVKRMQGLAGVIGMMLVTTLGVAAGSDDPLMESLERALANTSIREPMRMGGATMPPRLDAKSEAPSVGSASIVRAIDEWTLQGGDAAISMMPEAASSPELGAASRSLFEPEGGEDSDPDSFWEGWSGSLEGGVNGSEGNSETFNLRAGLGAERKTAKMVTKLTSEYAYSTNNGEKEKNRWFTEARNDWSLGKEQRWSFFVIGRLEYDDFQDWDWRASLFAGPGYKIVKTDKTLLNLRAGAGLTREFGGSRNEIIPEGLLGVDFEHQLTERQKLTSTVEYYPSFRNLSQYRLLARAGWEILIDPEVNMTLKLGVEDRYDSDPGEGFKKNDLDYFAVIVWKF